ncbi:variant surface glycoprotein (VSG), putative [Trypanosoma brucei brucei TREU927]|uniref:Variant surface glycoprotein (VSG), putative n=1 Tax=Trypanosoma brucei brucei (strain 927/4 GUTat10.1) TaxID=185431 RepID=Q380U8_TRYB2|nr:variant surface glycoprotein [Trypanosoma brucei brucei TREU927]EAN80683.1 variant surface glycoprotein (VSG), putative [Trypanosoma brucei brucei TREU927]
MFIQKQRAKEMTKLMYLAATAAMIFHGSNVGQAADDQEAENAQEFGALCNLIQLASKGFDSTEIKINNKLTELETDIQRAEILAYDNKTEIEKRAKEGTEGLKKGDKALPQTADGIAAAQKINETAKAAAALISALKDKIKKVEADTATANKHLYKAVWGKEEKPPALKPGAALFAGANASSIFGDTSSNTRTTNCGGSQFSSQSDTNVGKTLINDLVCICIDGQTGMKNCAATPHGVTTAQNNFRTPHSAINSAWDALIDECPQAQAKVNPGALQAALTSLLSLIGGNTHSKTTPTQNNKYILGWADATATGCNGATKQICVNYAPWRKTAANTEIRWQEEVREAIEAAPTATTESDITATINTLTTMNLSVWHLYEAGFASASTVKGEPTKEKIPPIAQEECNKHKSKKTCEEKNCKWEAKGGKSETEGTCKPKEGEGETSAAGAGDAGASDTAAKKCSDKKKEEECKSPNCKWDGKECKDSSILANKHFALMVSAAFVSLLEL